MLSALVGRCWPWRVTQLRRYVKENNITVLLILENNSQTAQKKTKYIPRSTSLPQALFFADDNDSRTKITLNWLCVDAKKSHWRYHTHDQSNNIIIYQIVLVLSDLIQIILQSWGPGFLSLRAFWSSCGIQLVNTMVSTHMSQQTDRWPQRNDTPFTCICLEGIIKPFKFVSSLLVHKLSLWISRCYILHLFRCHGSSLGPHNESKFLEIYSKIQTALYYTDQEHWVQVTLNSIQTTISTTQTARFQGQFLTSYTTVSLIQ